MMAKVVKACGYTLHIRCIAGIESCCYVESVDVAFDLGCLVNRVVNKSNVFITHGHIDHIGALMAHAARRALNKQKPAQYFVPAHLVSHLESIFKSTAAMQGDVPFPAHIIPLKAFDEVHLSPKYMVRVVPTKHRVPSLGFILYEKKKSLKPEYSLLSREEITALRRSGQEVTNVELTPEIAYTGDTTIEVFTSAADDERTKDLLRVKVLITEATYANSKKTIQDAVNRGHMHLTQLAAHEHLFQHVGVLVLVHFSARYKYKELIYCVRTHLSASLQQKIVLGCS